MDLVVDGTWWQLMCNLVLVHPHSHPPHTQCHCSRRVLCTQSSAFFCIIFSHLIYAASEGNVCYGQDFSLGSSTLNSFLLLEQYSQMSRYRQNLENKYDLNHQAITITSSTYTYSMALNYDKLSQTIQSSALRGSTFSRLTPFESS